MISDKYKELNKAMHKDNIGYGSSGMKWSLVVNELCGYRQTFDVLDYGCGKSTLQKTLNFPIKEYDPCIDGKDTCPAPADIVICADVLEHIEPEYIDDVLDDLKRVTKDTGFFVISTKPATKMLPDGRNAHILVKDWGWWKIKLKERFKIIWKAFDKTNDEEVMVIVRRKGDVSSTDGRSNTKDSTT